jgi:hypothetical protein
MGRCCFKLHTWKTNWLTDAVTMAFNKGTAKAQAATAKRARRPKSTPTIKRLHTFRALEKFIAVNVRSAPSNGFAKLLPHKDENNLYFNIELSEEHTKMFNDAMVMGRTNTMTPEEMLRRYTGQQLMLFTELILFCVPQFLSPGSNKKQRGENRSNLEKHKNNFVKLKPQHTVNTRAMALQYAKEARVCDVMYDDTTTELFMTVSGLSKEMVEPHEEDTLIMLSNTDLTPSTTLNTVCSKVMMQVQAAAKLGRMPSITSTLLSVLRSELDLFNEHNTDVAIDVETTPSRLKPYVDALEFPDVQSSAPPTLVRSILDAVNRKDVLHPYYTIPRLAHLLLERGEDLEPGTINSINCHFKNMLNGFIAVTPAAKPLYLQIDIECRPYQVLAFTKIS